MILPDRVTVPWLGVWVVIVLSVSVFIVHDFLVCGLGAWIVGLSETGWVASKGAACLWDKLSVFGGDVWVIFENWLWKLFWLWVGISLMWVLFLWISLPVSVVRVYDLGGSCFCLTTAGAHVFLRWSKTLTGWPGTSWVSSCEFWTSAAFCVPYI